MMDLSNEVYSVVISDQHLVEISEDCCTQWGLLPSHLGLMNTVKDDINKLNFTSEWERRHEFLKVWKRQKGKGATYRTLIEALQKIRCVTEAEYVSKLVQLPLTLTTSTQTEGTNGITEAPTSAVSTPGKIFIAQYSLACLNVSFKPLEATF